MNTVALTPRRAARWPWALGLLLVLAASAVAAVWLAISAIHPVPFSVVVDGEQVFQGVDLAGMDPGHKLGLALVVAFALLAAMVVLPVALLLALAGVRVGVLTVVGVPLLVAFVVLAVVLSPLWIGVWLLFKLLA